MGHGLVLTVVFLVWIGLDSSIYRLARLLSWWVGMIWCVYVTKIFTVCVRVCVCGDESCGLPHEKDSAVLKRYACSGYVIHQAIYYDVSIASDLSTGEWECTRSPPQVGAEYTGGSTTSLAADALFQIPFLRIATALHRVSYFRLMCGRYHLLLTNLSTRLMIPAVAERRLCSSSFFFKNSP